jgi:hypothetical protein
MKSRVDSSSSDIDSTIQKLLTAWNGGQLHRRFLGGAWCGKLKAESLRKGTGTGHTNNSYACALHLQEIITS